MATLEDGKPARSRADRTRGATMQLRVSEADRAMIDAAAAALGQTRTEFILSTARRHAIDALLDQRMVRLDAEAARTFDAALEEPAPSNAALDALMREPSPWR